MSTAHKPIYKIPEGTHPPRNDLYLSSCWFIFVIVVSIVLFCLHYNYQWSFSESQKCPHVIMKTTVVQKCFTLILSVWISWSCLLFCLNIYPSDMTAELFSCFSPQCSQGPSVHFPVFLSTSCVPFSRRPHPSTGQCNPHLSLPFHGGWVGRVRPQRSSKGFFFSCLLSILHYYISPSQKMICTVFLI